MEERIKELRQALGLTTRDFAARIGLSGGAISLLENGKRQPTQQFILSVCREFNVSEDWLVHGTGEMIAVTREHEIAVVVKQMHTAGEDDFRYRLQKLISEMSPEEIDTLHKLAQRLSDK